MLKNDRWINEQAAEGMLEPFQATLVRHLDPGNQASPVLSFGCSSYGYDLRPPSSTTTETVPISFFRPIPTGWAWPLNT